MSQEDFRTGGSNVIRSSPPMVPSTNIIFAERNETAENIDQTEMLGKRIEQQINMENIDPVKMGILAKNPFVEMLSWPTRCVSVLLQANVAADFRAPAGTRYVRFFGNGDYWVNRNGSAQIPSSSTFNSDDAYTMGAVYRPEGVCWYVRGDASFSVISGDVNRSVSMQCFIEE